MRESNWIAEARRRCNPELHLVRNPVQARLLEHHPDCLQVWDVDLKGQPYWVHSIHDRGMPRDPSEVDIMRIQKMASSSTHAGKESWIDELDRGAKHRYTETDEEWGRKMNEYFSPGGEGYEKIMYATKNRLVVATKIPGNQDHNLRKRRPR